MAYKRWTPPRPTPPSRATWVFHDREQTQYLSNVLESPSLWNLTGGFREKITTEFQKTEQGRPCNLHVASEMKTSGYATMVHGPAETA